MKKMRMNFFIHLKSKAKQNKTKQKQLSVIFRNHQKDGSRQNDVCMYKELFLLKKLPSVMTRF